MLRWNNVYSIQNNTSTNFRKKFMINQRCSTRKIIDEDAK